MYCEKCGGARTDPTTGNSVPDHCLGSLPGVISACCGHGRTEGYIIFENGTRIKFPSVTIIKGYLGGDFLKQALGRVRRSNHE